MNVVLVLSLLISLSQAQLLVNLPNGPIQGHQLNTFTNKSYHAFQAIPYASPPTGKLRFQPPERPSNWTEVIDATKDSHICYQLEFDTPEENEDCLYVNVFTPVLDRVRKTCVWNGHYHVWTGISKERNHSKLPVIFWIYGGGLRSGAALFRVYRPDYWMDEEVILVTHNYRVGIFGFLSTGDEIIPGNAGLKDQNLALQWTYENIHLFGGDKEKITLHGQSAGAVSASYHLLIKQSAGLFRSVIAESGTPMNMYSFIENPKEYAIELAQAINPNITSNASSEELKSFLLSLEGKTIDSYSYAPKIVQPAVVIEPESPSAVVTKAMYEMFDSGDFSRVPVLMGICSEEALFIASTESYPKELGGTYDADPSLVVPTIFPHSKEFDKNEIGKAIKEIYLNDSEVWGEHPGRVVRHFSDQRFSRAIIKQGKLLSQYVPVYFYQFSYDGAVGGWDIVVEDAEKIRHSEELSYVFLNKNLSEISTSDALTHNRLVRLWSNFVKYGNPTPEADQLLQNLTWPMVEPTDYKYLNINDSLSIEVDPKKDFFSKWEEVFNAYGQRPFATY